MEAPRTPQQLNISFQDGNPLAAKLRGGEFLVVVEVEAPLQSQPFESAVAQARVLARASRSRDLIAGMAVADRARSEDSHDPVDTATVLAEASGKPTLLHVSGKGSTSERVKSVLARGASAGIRNVLAVTGDRSDKHDRAPQEAGKRGDTVRYLDSVLTLALIQGQGLPVHSGAAVNPGKYTPADLYLQYFKMIRKLATGAEFLVAQVSWDMKKLQELQWFLQMREVGNPVLARTALLSPDDIATIHDGFFPGVSVSRTFAAILQRESNLSDNQCLAGQLNRIALQAAGCKLLGYSGVQLVGIRDERTLDAAMAKIGDALEEHADYADWVRAWEEYHGGIDFAPVPNPYYVFDGLLSAKHAMFQADACTPVDRPFPKASPADRARAITRRLFLSERTPRPIRWVGRSLLCRGCSEQACALAHCYYLCPADCPKHLVHGACGGSRPDGTCEFGQRPCFFRRVLALAARRQELDRLEEGVSGA